MALKAKRRVTKFFIRTDFDNQSNSFYLEKHFFFQKANLQNEIKDEMLSFLSFVSDILTKVCFPNLIIGYK